jgi:hypothetical protein
MNKKAGWKRVFLASVAFSILGLPLVSCNEAVMFKSVTTGILAATEGVFMRPDVNLRQKNHAAADFLVQEFRQDIQYGDSIEVRHLHEVDNNTLTSPLGMKIPEEIGMRLLDLGYTVNLKDVATGANKPLYIAAPQSFNESDFFLTGSYLRNRKDVDVYLRVVNAKSGQIVAAFDYKLYLTAEVRKLAETPVQIYRVGRP